MNRYFYKYEFISPENIYAKIKEELRSYFATGAIDDLLFSTWVDYCLRHLGKSSYPIVDDVIDICDFKGTLPVNFIKAREVWACGLVNAVKYQQPSATYTELSSKIDDSGDHRCEDEGCTFPDEIKVIYKTTKSQVYKYHKQWLLIPGNINVRQYCSDDCLNFDSSCDRKDTFDIHGNKLITSFREGKIYLLYYSSSEDREGNQLVPDNFRILNYIEAYIKYKLFEQLCNQTTDETYNQIERKKQEYEAKSNEAYVLMDIESKKKTVEEKIQSINRTKRRNRQYIIR